MKKNKRTRSFPSTRESKSLGVKTSHRYKDSSTTWPITIKRMTSKRRSSSWKTRHGWAPFWGRRKRGRRNARPSQRWWKAVLRLTTREVETKLLSWKKMIMWREAHRKSQEGARTNLHRHIGNHQASCSRTTRSNTPICHTGVPRPRMRRTRKWKRRTWVGYSLISRTAIILSSPIMTRMSRTTPMTGRERSPKDSPKTSKVWDLARWN